MQVRTSILSLVLVVGVCALASHCQGSVLYAVSADNYLTTFDSSNPGSLMASRPITGLQGSEKIEGLDFFNNGSGGILYALGDSSRLYVINPNTGQAAAVGAGQFSPTLNGTAFGFENTPAGAVVISDLRYSVTINRTTGVTDSNNNPLPAASHVTALAYAGGSGTLYGIDSLANTLVTVNLAAGTTSTIGALGIDCSRLNGFDIDGSTTTGYFVSPAASADPAANLYTVNLATGAVTLVGLVGAPGDDLLFRALTVEVTPLVSPEPATLAVLAAGGLLLARRRRRRLA